MKVPEKYYYDTPEIPIYGQIADIIRTDILESKIPVGKQLFSEDKLANKFDVSLVTIRRALNLLSEEKLISRNRKKGTFVSKDALKHLKHKNIGLIMPALGAELTLSQSPTNYLIFDGIQKFCFEHLWDIQIMQSKLQTFSWQRFEQSNIAGVIIALPKRSTYELIYELKKRQIPFLCINLHSEAINKDVNYLNLDFYNTTIDAVQYLYNQGKKSIALINARKLDEDGRSLHIINGYKNATEMLQLEENIINIPSDDNTSDRVRDFLRDNFQAVKQYDAFIATAPDTAFELFKGLEECNISLPPTSLITLFENVNTRASGITSYTPDIRDVGYKSIQLLNELFNDKDKTLKQKEIKLQLRDSTI
ncbi:MAG: GntR family transcriptional regulator [Candidatus Gracilibacteria bacterium]|nr:GntR family transcriptional regulator [Candidatus Gracilibacteria bacterium]